MTSTASSSPEGPLVLILNGAEERLQFAIAEERDSALRLLAHQQWDVPGQSVRFLAPALDQALRLFGSSAASVRRIACVRGPGSFTGLRLSLAAAAGLAAGNGASLAGLETLPLLARTPARCLRGTVLALTWARKGQVYAQAFACPDARPLGPAQTLKLDEAAALASGCGGPVHLLGSGLRRNLDFFAAAARQDENIALLPAGFDQPDAQALLEAAAEAVYGNAAVEALYLRPSDAEEGLEGFARTRGLTLKQARDMIRPGTSLK